jgi:protein tyrosine phosphatase (PTP) superfamily phosphohydrolase (DUF442 family)
MPRLAAAFAASLCLAGAILAQPAGEPIDRFLRVDDRVCTGGQPTAAQLAELKRDGVRTIISLREPSEYDARAEAEAAKELELAFVGIPVQTTDPKDDEVMVFLRVTSKPEIFPAFIHCGSGNRVGAFWLIRRVLVDGWTVEKAEEEARRIGLRSPNLVEFATSYIQRHPRAD